RKAVILKVENNNNTYPSLIKNFLKIKYGLEKEVTKKKLEEPQLANLYNEIENRKPHSRLYSARNNKQVSLNNSSKWLKKGIVGLRNEAGFCYFQDRNVFWDAEGMSTRCEKMFSPDYKDDIRSGTISHSVQEILDNEYAEIKVDTRIKTDNRITLIDVGITTQDSLRIYEVLANELEAYINHSTQESRPNAEESWKNNRQRGRGSEIGKYKTYLPLILHGMTTAKEPTTNTNEELELEEEIEVVEIVERIILKRKICVLFF
ncbi:hypothetical protein CWI38_1458p0010, partial [Hamiltosporidium tvaerminnensis]